VVSPLFLKLWRDIGRHRAQFIAITLTMFLGVTIFGATYDSFRNLEASYSSTATEYRFANLTVHGGDVNGVVQAAANLSAVDSVEVRTVADIPLQVGDVKLLGRIVSVPAGGQPTVNELKVTSGSYLDPAVPDGVLVEQHMADHFKLVPGDTLQVLAGSTWTQVTVQGVVSSPEYIWPARNRQEIITTPDNFGVIFPSDALAATLAPNPQNEAVFYYTGGTPNPQATTQLTAKAHQLGATDIYTRAEQPSNAGLSEDLKGFQEMAIFFPMMFLLAAGMAAYVMISRLVHSQRPHIGVFVANGFTRGQVLRHYLGYGLVPGLIGSIPGAVAGILLARVITRMYTSMLSVPVTLVQFYPLTLIGAIVFGLVASLLAALAPALVASRVRPAAAMRGETPTGGGRLSIVERIIPPLRRIPVAWRMAVRGVGRNPRRTTYTIIGVVLSLMLVLVSWGMIDTIDHLMNKQFVEIQREDATVYFTSSVSTSEVTALESVPGVARAEPDLTLGASLSSGPNHYETSLQVLENNTQMHRFPTTNGDWIGLPDQGLVVGKAIESILDVKVGDPITVTATGGITFTEPIADFVDEPLGTFAYIARDRADALVGSQLPATSALVSYAPGADANQLRQTLTNRPEIAAFEDAKALFTTMQQYMVLFYAFVGVMLAFGAAMAFALIFNAMSVNIAERTREVATLLAVGTDRRHISRYITTENLLVVTMGIPLGLVAGYFASKAAMASFSSDLFDFSLFIKPTTYVWAALAMLVVAFVSQWPGLRAIRRLSIAKIVKERSA
jgi:putative ABC transport system permease protein